jgi:hypothetical protein
MKKERHASQTKERERKRARKKERKKERKREREREREREKHKRVRMRVNQGPDVIEVDGAVFGAACDVSSTRTEGGADWLPG